MVDMSSIEFQRAYEDDVFGEALDSRQSLVQDEGQPFYKAKKPAANSITCDSPF